MYLFEGRAPQSLTVARTSEATPGQGNFSSEQPVRQSQGSVSLHPGRITAGLVIEGAMRYF
jgi:hypothetical protein